MTHNSMVFDPRDTALPLLAPGILLLMGYALLSGIGSLPWSWRAGLALAPYAVLAGGLVVSCVFHCGRAVYSLLLVAIGHWLLVEYFAGGWRGGVAADLVYAAYCDLLPLNLILFAFLKERGILTPLGLNRFALIALQVAAVALIAGAGTWLEASAAETLREAASGMLHARLLPPSFDFWTHLPQPAILAFAFALIGLLARLVMTQAPLEGGSLGALAAAAVALHMVGQGPAPTVFFTIASLILSLAVIHDAYRMAFLDDLTGLPARRALNRQKKNLRDHYAIAMLDIDHFKKFNDTYGHDVGDQVLKMVASQLKKVTGGGKPFRYGGEEFAILFAGKGTEETLRHLEDLRASVAASKFRLRDKNRPETKPNGGETPRDGGGETSRHRQETSVGTARIGVTISLGVAERNGGDSTPDGVLKAADQALYRAKNAGRNRIGK
ncbi:MAG: GGDEF domain-containing protein [Rhodospirillales bacterium]|nr:GGDEF domain-containing protein [Rhodospirillales bacterium]